MIRLRRARAAAPLLALVVALPLGACSSPQETYCQAVEEHQDELSEIAASEEPGAVLGTLDAYRDLRSKAPRDIRDEWTHVLTRLEALDEALAGAGVDPASYDPAATAADLSGDDRSAIEAAARDIGRAETVEAMGGVEQQALDVCGTPLSQ
jgi:hypothetical protein